MPLADHLIWGTRMTHFSLDGSRVQPPRSRQQSDLRSLSSYFQSMDNDLCEMSLLEHKLNSVDLT